MEGDMDPDARPFDQTERANGAAEGADAAARGADAAARGADGGATEVVAETRSARFARKAHRTRLYVYAGVAVVLLVFLIALVLANTGRVKVSWVFGHSLVSLVWLVLFTAILGLLLGMVLGALFHWRTRRPRG
jgi:uncharacterized integral membrane protein